jgi:hypothetical protein
MFFGCNSLTSFPSGFDFSKVTTMSYMFAYDTDLTSVSISSITSACTSTTYMFKGCTNLTGISLSNVNYVTLMQGMFQDCINLIEVTGMVANRVLNADDMFNGCTSLTSVTLQLSWIDDLGSNSGMFSGCTSLTNCYLDRLSHNIQFAQSPNLTEESIMYMINNSQGTGGGLTMKLHPTAKARLTADDLQVATNKNWTITT